MRTALALAIVVAIVLVTSCGRSERSREAFCDTFASESQRLSDKYSNRTDAASAEADPLGAILVGMGSLIEAQGDIVVLMDRLSKVAPSDIEPEVTAIHGQLESQMETLTDPSGGLGGLLLGGLVSGLQLQGSYDRLDDYVRINCS